MSLDRRILIADDDAALRGCVSELLGDLGLEIIEAESGLEALSIVRAGRVHLALLDYRMPGPTGLEVLIRIHDELLPVPVILCSGELNQALETMALRAGARAVMRKPLVPDALRAQVASILGLGPPPR
jgi:CheY-like chemotaxis protein